MAFEILIRDIDENGNAKEQQRITLQDGRLPDRALILAEAKKETGQTMLCRAGCDEAEACMMIHHNKEMKNMVRIYMLGEMAVRMMRMMHDDDEEEEPEEDDAADGIGQAFSPD